MYPEQHLPPLFSTSSSPPSSVPLLLSFPRWHLYSEQLLSLVSRRHSDDDGAVCCLCHRVLVVLNKSARNRRSTVHWRGRGEWRDGGSLGGTKRRRQRRREGMDELERSRTDLITFHPSFHPSFCLSFLPLSFPPSDSVTSVLCRQMFTDVLLISVFDWLL